MKTRPVATILFVFTCIGTLFSQTTITRSLQGFRDGDVLYKQQVQYKDPGRKGYDVVWDFSQLKPLNENYKVNYYEPATKRGGDTVCITCVEHFTMYKYAYKGDSLLMLGFENTGSRLTLDKPEYSLHYPFTFGDSITSTYKGDGSYLNTLLSETEGQLTTVADAVGTLILPDGDTIYNVLRVRSEHSYKQSTLPIVYRAEKDLERTDTLTINGTEATTVETPDSSSAYTENVMQVQVEGNQSYTKKGNALTGENASAGTDEESNRMKRKHVLKEKTDSIFFRTETCRWYAPGYRYPLFETICNHSHKTLNETIEMRDIETAFYFPPSMHAYLDNDPENKAILDSIKQLKERGVKEPSDTLSFDYNIYPNPVKTDIQVDLLLDLPSSVVISVFTTSGECAFRKEEGFFDAGQHTFSLQLGQLRFGEYLLYIKVNEQFAQMVLLKK